MTDARNNQAVSSLSLKGKVAFITGGNKGIGKGIALAMAAAGADVVITGRDQASAQGVLDEIRKAGVRTAFVPADLNDDAVVGSLIDTAVAQFGQIDILVNNAAIGPEKPALDITLDDWREMMKLNLEVPFRLAQAAARHLIARGGGAIINISSIRGQNGGVAVDEAHYTAAKTGLNGLTRALAREWAGQGVRVNSIAPGLILTDMTQHWQDDPETMGRLLARYPVNRGGYPRDIGGVAVFLASEASDFMHGQVLTVDGGRTTG